MKRANNTTYGLASVVMTNDMNVSEKLVKNLEAGTVFVNTYCIPQSFIPFGGYKESGFGRDNGEEGVLEYTRVKAVYYNLLSPNTLWRVYKIIIKGFIKFNIKKKYKYYLEYTYTFFMLVIK